MAIAPLIIVLYPKIKAGSNCTIEDDNDDNDDDAILNSSPSSSGPNKSRLGDKTARGEEESPDEELVTIVYP